MDSLTQPLCFVKAHKQDIDGLKKEKLQESKKN